MLRCLFTELQWGIKSFDLSNETTCHFEIERMTKCSNMYDYDGLITELMT